VFGCGLFYKTHYSAIRCISLIRRSALIEVKGRVMGYELLGVNFIKRFVLFVTTAFIFLLFIEFNKQPEYKISEAIAKSEVSMSNLMDIDTIASSVDGKDIKFRIMVYKYPTLEEATELFKSVIDNIETYSAHPGVWDYYEGYFDIKAYDRGVIYEATKLINKDLKVMSKKDRIPK
jgi:hypothetical protein